MVRTSRADAGLPAFQSLTSGDHESVVSEAGVGETRARRPPLFAAAGAQATARAAIGSNHFVTAPDTPDAPRRLRPLGAT
jgi:hypothetical protein